MKIAYWQTPLQIFHPPALSILADVLMAARLRFAAEKMVFQSRSFSLCGRVRLVLVLIDCMEIISTAALFHFASFFGKTLLFFGEALTLYKVLVHSFKECLHAVWFVKSSATSAVPTFHIAHLIKLGFDRRVFKQTRIAEKLSISLPYAGSIIEDIFRANLLRVVFVQEGYAV
jgi:hypothetical protein